MKLKKIMAGIIAAITIIGSNVCYAEDIPYESLPAGVTMNSVLIAETLISDSLDEVRAGAGYADVWYKANNSIMNAIAEGRTNGYGYGVLAPITRNALLQYRDMYLRPDYYINAEAYVKPLIDDLILKVRTGEISKTVAVREGCIRVLQATDASFNPDTLYMQDTCYWNIPTIDPVQFAMVRKLINQ